MAARRFTKSTINWAALIERIPEAQKAEFHAFKSKIDGNLRKVSALPEEPPKIDWNSYKAKVPIPGLVESFQKQYEALKIPYPQDTFSSHYQADEAEMTKNVNDFVAKATAKIKEHEEKLKYFDTIPPIETMTLQEFAQYYPDQALDALNRPTFWPHREEDQPTQEDIDEWNQKLKGIEKPH